MPRRGSRCYLLYATAPEGVTARAANDALNDYGADRSRGIQVFHDHFTGKPHGGLAVVYPRSDEEAQRLGAAGRRLAEERYDWKISGDRLAEVLEGVAR